MLPVPSDASRWSIAVLASRETPETLRDTVNALQYACAGVPSTIDVIVNGNRELAEALVAINPVRSDDGVHVRVWFLALGDKANAWNVYFTHIAPPADVVYFVDGYAVVTPKSLAAIDRAFVASPDAWAATGVPTYGRSAKRLRAQMLSGGGIHGNLYALRGSIAELLKQRGFHYPLGMYRSDPLLGAVVCFSADPEHYGWQQERLCVVADATWAHEPLRWYRLNALQTQWKRMERQAQGVIENAAVRHHLAICRRAPETLPHTIAQLVSDWMAASPKEAARLMRHPLRRRAAARLALPRDWSSAAIAPELLVSAKTGRR